MKKNIFLFVGPHRSGTYFLNTQILPNVPNVYATYVRKEKCTSLLWNAMEGHPFFRNIEAIRDEIFALLEGVEEDNIVIGNQDFFGDYGHHNSDGCYISTPFYDQQDKTDFLAKVFDNPKIILTPRRQDTWVESSYMHFIHHFHSFTMDEYLDPDRSPAGGWFYPYSYRSEKPSLDYRALDWSVYLENYHRVFGKENVLVLPLEMTVRDLEHSLARLYEFMGVEGYYPKTVPTANASLSKTAYRLAMIFNRFIKTRSNRFGFIPTYPFLTWVLNKRAKKDNKFLWFLSGVLRRVNWFWFLRNVVSRFGYERPIPLSSEKRKEILAHFRDSNKKYAEMIGVDLGKYGYY